MNGKIVIIVNTGTHGKLHYSAENFRTKDPGLRTPIIYIVRNYLLRFIQIRGVHILVPKKCDFCSSGGISHPCIFCMQDFCQLFTTDISMVTESVSHLHFLI